MTTTSWGWITDHNGVPRKLGYIPDLADHRDLMYSTFKAVSPQILQKLPKSINLNWLFPPVDDQGSLGACTGFAWVGIRSFMESLDSLNLSPLQILHNGDGALEQFHKLSGIIREVGPTFWTQFSPLWVYYKEREIEGTIEWDHGAFIRTGAKVLAAQGAALERDWPYDRYQETFDQKPSAVADQNAMGYQIERYRRVSVDLNELKMVLADGYPIVGGWSIYESFYEAGNPENPVIRMPGKDEVCLGGHAMVLTGYDTAVNAFMVRNSWGSAWGDQGYALMDFQYAVTYGTDLWMCSKWE